MSLLLPPRARSDPPSDQALYDQVASSAAGLVIGTYSSSFGLASRLLPHPLRADIGNLYALVRLADEVVDGSLARQRPARAGELLDRLESETLETLREGYSTNLVVHAFTATARAAGIDHELVTPFFASMRTDLTVRRHDAASFETYVYGSAEVVGLMCLRVFLARSLEPGDRQQRYVELAGGARRLGAAFQKINFLRDLAADYEDRGRCYLPGIDPAGLSEDDKHRVLDDIDADLEAASDAIGALPPGSRRAVRVAHGVFDELAARLRSTPAAMITQRRIRLSSTTKARVAVAALARERRA